MNNYWSLYIGAAKAAQKYRNMANTYKHEAQDARIELKKLRDELHEKDLQLAETKAECVMLEDTLCDANPELNGVLIELMEANTLIEKQHCKIRRLQVSLKEALKENNKAIKEADEAYHKAFGEIDKVFVEAIDKASDEA